MLDTSICSICGAAIACAIDCLCEPCHALEEDLRSARRKMARESNFALFREARARETSGRESERHHMVARTHAMLALTHRERIQDLLEQLGAREHVYTERVKAVLGHGAPRTDPHRILETRRQIFAFWTESRHLDESLIALARGTVAEDVIAALIRRREEVAKAFADLLLGYYCTFQRIAGREPQVPAESVAA